MYWSPQLLGHSFQKARNFSARSHQNAGFSIWVFKNFPGVIPGPSQWEGATPSYTQYPAWPLTGHGVRCSDPNLGSPRLFSCGCAPVLLYRMQTILDIINYKLVLFSCNNNDGLWRWNVFIWRTLKEVKTSKVSSIILVVQYESI